MKYFIILKLLGQISIQNYPDTVLIDSTPTMQNVYQTIINDSIKYPDIVLAQAILESNKFKSKLAIYNHNLFGMTNTNYRPHIGKFGKKYFIYQNFKYSILDYKLYQDYIINKKHIQTKQQYLNYIYKHYAQNKSYRLLLNKFIQYYRHDIDKISDKSRLSV
jgi:flagellum-specific peptidoglycan hydrolase FlgJ